MILHRKILLNDQVDAYFHPNAISFQQVRNNLYFFQILTNKTDHSQTVLLRKLDLVTGELESIESEEIQPNFSYGKLLSVGFFKKKDQVLKNVPILISNDDQDLPR